MSNIEDIEEFWRSTSDENLKENLKSLHSFGLPEAKVITAEAMRRWHSMSPPSDNDTNPIVPESATTRAPYPQAVKLSSASAITPEGYSPTQTPTPTLQAVRLVEIDIPFGSMIALAFKWFWAVVIAGIPIAIIYLILMAIIAAITPAS
jgi:hypothetical protein